MFFVIECKQFLPAKKNAMVMMVAQDLIKPRNDSTCVLHICENKDAVLLRDNLCFRYIDNLQSLFFLNPKFKASYLAT